MATNKPVELEVKSDTNTHYALKAVYVNIYIHGVDETLEFIPDKFKAYKITNEIIRYLQKLSGQPYHCYVRRDTDLRDTEVRVLLRTCSGFNLISW
jgi:hypothetical protein